MHATVSFSKDFQLDLLDVLYWFETPGSNPRSLFLGSVLRFLLGSKMQSPPSSPS